VKLSYCSGLDEEQLTHELEFSFVVTDEDRREIQWYLEDYLIYPWGEWCNRAKRVEQLMEELGAGLFRALFGNSGASEIYSHMSDDLANTRIVIQADSTDGIALPWEIIRDPMIIENGYLALMAKAFVRSETGLIVESQHKMHEKGSLNILMVICRPGGKHDVPFQSVSRPLLEIFKQRGSSVHIDVLRPPTFENLSEVLSAKPGLYHVLHFDGHGQFPDGTGLEGRLVFEKDCGSPHYVGGQELGAILKDKGLALIVLNACQTGMTRPDALFPTVANQLLRVGVHSVVAMAYSVYVQTSVRFMARLYEELLMGQELATAVAFAREELRSHPERLSLIGSVNLRDWFVPNLFEAAPVRFDIKPTKGKRIEEPSFEKQSIKVVEEVNWLKKPVFGFVGRDGEILEIERAFRTETIVLLKGMAGSGKTETAAGFARWWNETGALEGTIFFFCLKRYLPLKEIYNVLGYKLQLCIKKNTCVEWKLQTTEQSRDIILEILRQTRCLIILDNVESVAGLPAGSQSEWEVYEQEELREFLTGLIGGKTKVLLISTRDEKWIGKHCYCMELPGLQFRESQEFALRVLHKAGIAQSEMQVLPQYNDLLKHLLGNPLAMQIVLPDLKIKSPEELILALRSSVDRIPLNDPQRSLECYDLNLLLYRLGKLDSRHQRLLALLCLFQRFVATDVLALICSQEGAPASICGLGRDEWRPLLDTAAELGMLRRETDDFFTIHPLGPLLFVDIKCEIFSNNKNWLERSFISVYDKLGTFFGSNFQHDPENTTKRLHLEENNMLYALWLGRRYKYWDSLSGLLFGLRMLFCTHGRWDEWEQLIASIEDEILNANGESLPGAESLWETLLGHRSEIAMYRRDFNTARRIHLRLKEHFQRTGDQRNLATMLQRQGIISQESDNLTEAEQLFLKALAIFKELDIDVGQAKTLHHLGVVAQNQARYDEAVRWFKKSLDIKERMGDKHGQAATCSQLARIAMDKGQFEEAKKWYRQVHPIFQSLGDVNGQAIVFYQLGIIAAYQKQFEEAEQCLRMSLALLQRVGNDHGQAKSLHALGNIAQRKGQLGEAVRWYKESLAIRMRLGDKQEQGSTFYTLGMVAHKSQHFSESEEWLNKALEVFQQTGDKQNQAKTLKQLGILSVDCQKFKKAEQWTIEALKVLEQIGSDRGLANALHQLGNIAFVQSHWAEAERWYCQSLTIGERLGDERGESITLSQLVVIAKIQSHPEKAEMWSQRLIAIKKRLGDKLFSHSELQEPSVMETILSIDVEKAERMQHHSFDAAADVSDDCSQALSLLNLGRIAAGKRDFDEAQRKYQRTLDIFRRIDNKNLQVKALFGLSEIAEKRGQVNEAERCYRQILIIEEQSENGKG